MGQYIDQLREYVEERNINRIQVLWGTPAKHFSAEQRAKALLDLYSWKQNVTPVQSLARSSDHTMLEELLRSIAKE